MLERGSIKREGADRYWIDVVAYDVDVHRRHRRVRLALVILSIVLAVALIAVELSGGHKLTLQERYTNYRPPRRARYSSDRTSTISPISANRKNGAHAAKMGG